MTLPASCLRSRALRILALIAFFGLSGCASDEQPAASEETDGSDETDSGESDSADTGNEVPGVADCLPNQIQCGGECVNPSLDVEHCGTCERSCGPGQICSGSVCGCQGGLLSCGGQCADPQTDEQNCGECNVRCPTGRACVNGSCACSDGTTLCGIDCVNTESDAQNCGGCGTQCGADEICDAGECRVMPCTDGRVRCAGVCVDPSNDEFHCGGCNQACAGGEQCLASSCACESAVETSCGEQCVDLAQDSLHCGECGNACMGGTLCQAGVCECSADRDWCDEQCVDTRAHSEHCGACGNACVANEQCQAGVCDCAPNFERCGEGCTPMGTCTPDENIDSGAGGSASDTGEGGAGGNDNIGGSSGAGARDAGTGGSPQEGFSCAPACGAGSMCCPQNGLETSCIPQTEEGCQAADLTVSASRASESAIVEWMYFEPDHCALAEACVGGSGWRRILLFDTFTPNIGTADMTLGEADESNPIFEYSACHDHFHFTGYAEYRLLDGGGTLAASGHKQAFCLLDSEPYSTDDGTIRQQPFYDCENQGISRGWGDTYGVGLDCQWVDVTDVAPGAYKLNIRINTERRLQELRYDNNEVSVDVQVPEGTDPPLGP